MITINLLPPERRHKERTPLIRLLAIYASVALCLVLIFWDINTHLKISDTREMLQSKQQELNKLKEATRDFDLVQQAVQKANQRKTAIETIKSSRSFFWWETVDQLLDVICDNPRVWITSLEGKMGSPGSSKGRSSTKEETEAELAFHCLSAGLDLTLMTAFRTKLKNHPGLKTDFPLINEPPEFEATSMAQYVEEWALRFDIKLSRIKNSSSPKK